MSGRSPGVGAWVSRVAVLVDESVEDINALDAAGSVGANAGEVDRGSGHVKVDAAVWAGGVVVVDVCGQDPLEVASVEDQDPVQALGPDGAYPALRVGVGFRRPRWGLERLDTGCGEHRAERRGELAVAIPNEQPEPIRALVEAHQQIPGGLGDPRAGGVGGDSGQVCPALLQFDDEEHVQPGEPYRFDGEEVAGECPSGLYPHRGFSRARRSTAISTSFASDEEPRPTMPRTCRMTMNAKVRTAIASS